MKKLIIIIAFISSGIYLKAQSWLPLGSGVTNSISVGIVRSLGVYNGNLIAGGAFDTAGGISDSDIASWNGSSWSALGTGINGVVTALTTYNGKLIAGGSFSMAGGNSASNIASWNGTTWSALGTGMNGSVNTLIAYNGNLIAGGTFTTAGGNAANYIASWNGTTWSTLGTGLNSVVNSLDTSVNNLYVGGNFTTAGGNAANYIAVWNGTTWSTLGTGMGNTVYSMALYGGHLIAGGSFTTAGGNAANYIASWNGTTWSALASGMPGPVNTMATIDTNLFATTIYVSNNVQNWDGTRWVSLPGTLDTLYTLGAYKGNLYAGGGFRYIGLTQVNYIAEWPDSSSSLGINDISSLNAEATIFPNPGNGKFTVELKNAQPTIKNTIYVYNMLGEKIFTGNLNSTNTEIDLSTNEEGIYLYRIITDNGYQVSEGKLIIQ